jgi:hypothetical protein
LLFARKTMLKQLNYRIISAAALLVALAAGVASCEKPRTGPGYIAVRVVNEDTVAIQNAWIHLSAPGSGTLFDNPNTSGYYYKKSDVSGWTDTPWKYEREAYLDIESTKGAYRGCSYVHVVPGDTAVAYVILRPYGDPNSGCL